MYIQNISNKSKTIEKSLNYFIECRHLCLLNESSFHTRIYGMGRGQIQIYMDTHKLHARERTEEESGRIWAGMSHEMGGGKQLRKEGSQDGRSGERY